MKTIDPLKVLWLHKHGTQTGHGLGVGLHRGGFQIEVSDRKVGQGQMQILLCSQSEVPACKGRGFASSVGTGNPNDDVQLRRESREEMGIGPKYVVQLRRRAERTIQPLSKLPAFDQRQQALRRPQGDRGSPRP